MDASAVIPATSSNQDMTMSMSLNCPGKVGAAGQAVVAAADDDGVIFNSAHER